MKYFILGIIQGLTEFLPVSSSGHLVIAQKILGITDNQLLIILACHFGTLFAMVLFFFKDIVGLFKKPGLIGHIILVTVITGIIGLAGKDFFESLFASPKAVSISLFITGAVLIFSRNFQRGKRGINSIDIRDSLFLGLMQAFSIIPGISRSGMTISSLLFRNIDKQSAFKLSFLAGMPAIAGAFVLELKDVGTIAAGQLSGLVMAALVSFIVGFFALAALRSMLDRAKFHYFGYYCIALAVSTWILLR
jgi:undecaprenyl-diphosphatase